MSSSKRVSANPNNFIRVVGIVFDGNHLVVALNNGRTLAAPVESFPALRDATDAQRDCWELIGGGVGIHWEEIDEDLSVAGILNEARSRER